MLYRTMAVLLSGTIAVFVTGCASSIPTMRAQSPQNGYGSWSDGPASNHDCPMCQSSDGHAHGHAHGQACPPSHGSYGGHHSAANCQGAGCNLPFHPVHRNFHTYQTPQNLMYPPENAAPAQVQYPYYTFRGPTDFFME